MLGEIFKNNPPKSDIPNSSISSNSNFAKGGGGSTNSNSNSAKGGGGSTNSNSNSAKGGVPERSIKSILKASSYGNANSIPITNGFNPNSNRIDILVSVNSLTIDFQKNTHHGILYEEDMCDNCRSIGEQCQKCKCELDEVRSRGFFNRKNNSKNVEDDSENVEDDSEKYDYLKKNTSTNARQPIKKGQITTTITFSANKHSEEIGKNLIVPLCEEPIIKKSKVFKISKKRPEGCIEYVIFFKVDDNEVSLRFFSKTKLSNQDVKDALEFFNTHSANSFSAILYISDKIEFKPKPTSDEAEKYSDFKCLPVYEDIDVKRFNILGVVANFRIGELHDKYSSCKQGLENMKKHLNWIEKENGDLLKINNELISACTISSENCNTLLVEIKKEELEKNALLIALRKAELERDIAESERDAALLALSRKSDELIQLRKEILKEGSIKIGLNTLCEGDESSSSSYTVHTFFHLFIYFLTLMMMYITMTDTTKTPVHIKPTKKQSEHNPRDNAAENRDSG